MAALLARLIAAQRSGQAAAGVSLGYLAQLRSAFGAEPAAPHATAVPGLIDPLTSRELEVLPMLAAGKPNQAIAGPARRHPRYCQEARQPHHGQARRGQPHRGRHPGTPARPHPLAARPCQSPVTRHYPGCGPGTSGTGRRLYRVSTSG
jgi:hypothetical protein